MGLLDAKCCVGDRPPLIGVDSQHSEPQVWAVLAMEEDELVRSSLLKAMLG
jgi:hypothetical protein